MNISVELVLLSIILLGSSLSVLVFLIYYFSNKNNNKIHFYLIGKILQTLAWMFFASFSINELPGFIITIPNSMLLIGSAIEVYCIIRITEKETLKLKRNLSSLTFFAILVFLWFSYDVTYRTVILSVTLAILFSTLFVYATLKQKLSKMQAVVGWMALAYSIGNIIRATYTYYSDVIINPYSAEEPIQVFTAFLWITVIFTFPLFYLFVLKEKDNFKLKELKKQSASIAKELRQLIETANATIFGIDTHGLINEWNHTTEQITKISKQDAMGNDLVQNYITEDYRESVKKVLDNALEGKETSNFEFPLYSKDNQKQLILSNFSTRRNAQGEIVGVLGVGQDITELVEYKENLESKVKLRTQELQESLEREKELGVLKTNFVSMVSHEFRTPLAAINATTDVLQKYCDRLSKEDVDKRLSKIKGEIKGLTNLLEDVIILGKSNYDNLSFQPIQLNLTEYISTLIYEYNLSLIENRNIIFSKPAHDITVNADPKWIKHLVINLLSNAIKFSNQPVEVTLSTKNNVVLLSFKDYGIGIPKENMKHLFDPFYRGENVGNISGTGLGMVVTDKAIELHGGSIDVESEVDKGSTFTVTLPQFTATLDNKTKTVAETRNFQ